MFHFNFNSEKDECQLNKKEKNDIEWFKSEEITFSQDAKRLVQEIPESKIKKIKYGCELTFSICSPSWVMELLKKGSGSKDFADIIIADRLHSDLIPGKYEGGLKTWECTKDMAMYFYENIIKKSSEKLLGKRILDLGCGSGILGILCLKYEACVIFQDYNKEVLEMMTIPNVLLNCIDINDKVSFYCGDWSSFLELFQEQNGDIESKFDFILTSETIYNVDNYDKLIGIFNNLLKSDGKAFVASKSHYYGVGGTLFDFLNRLEKNKFKSKVVWGTDEGISRKIVVVEKEN